MQTKLQGRCVRGPMVISPRDYGRTKGNTIGGILEIIDREIPYS
jgi:hypothetical protein